jgi:hypothetical protein
MYYQKHQSAVGSVIDITSTASNIFDLINTAASTELVNAGFSGDTNAIDIAVIDGDIRVLFDENVPTAGAGFLLSSGTTHYFRGVPLKKMQLIRVGAVDVECNVMIGKSKEGESSSSMAHDITIEASGIAIGDVGIVGPAGTSATATDDAAYATAIDAVVAMGGHYSSADDMVDSGDAGILAMTQTRHLKVQSDSFDAGESADRGFDISPESSVYQNPSVDTGAVANATPYELLIDLGGLKGCAFGWIEDVTNGDTFSVTFWGCMSDPDNDSSNADFIDVTTNGMTIVGGGLTADGAAHMNVGMNFRYLKMVITTTAAGTGANDSEFIAQAKAWY